MRGFVAVTTPHHLAFRNYSSVKLPNAQYFLPSIVGLVKNFKTFRFACPD